MIWNLAGTWTLRLCTLDGKELSAPGYERRSFESACTIVIAPDDARLVFDPLPPTISWTAGEAWPPVYVALFDPRGNEFFNTYGPDRSFLPQDSISLTLGEHFA